jgi:hypothetical protein
MFFSDVPSFPHCGAAQESFFQESVWLSMDPPMSYTIKSILHFGTLFFIFKAELLGSSTSDTLSIFYCFIRIQILFQEL